MLGSILYSADSISEYVIVVYGMPLLGVMLYLNSSGVPTSSISSSATVNTKSITAVVVLVFTVPETPLDNEYPTSKVTAHCELNASPDVTA